MRLISCIKDQECKLQLYNHLVVSSFNHNCKTNLNNLNLIDGIIKLYRIDNYRLAPLPFASIILQWNFCTWKCHALIIWNLHRIQLINRIYDSTAYMYWICKAPINCIHTECHFYKTVPWYNEWIAHSFIWTHSNDSNFIWADFIFLMNFTLVAISNRSSIWEKKHNF